MAFPLRVLKGAKWLFALLVIVLIIMFILFSWQTEVTKNIDSYVYELPFAKGTKHRVVQGYGGLFSHIHTAAVDFTIRSAHRFLPREKAPFTVIKMIAMKADSWGTIRIKPII